jgi:nucleotide-binding universal stress UspA family protein
VQFAAKLGKVTVHLVHVQVPHTAISVDSGESQREAKPEEVLLSAGAVLEAADVPYTSEIVEGYVGAMIVAQAKQHGCDGIVMGTRGMGSTDKLLGSIARQVIQFAEVPVTLVK